ncbi:hypothetical protein [Phytoactinopolyspora halotolerans]|uniref:Uncharacterized protein n=1 Tax=Phytoactinopolyspora halotolerans TaxID=1981512 RepID=A0A6L9S655_9ACTN|nr:hypothetical protein [Phytoactinopolyspora halotolerans]NEE00134.1 hypothetical protein [Phytoactinopolyspora halotolerans]
MSDAKPKYNRFVNPEVANGEPFYAGARGSPRSWDPQRSLDSLGPLNPWLVLMGCLGGLAFAVGIVLHVGGEEPLRVVYVDDYSVVLEDQTAVRDTWGILAVSGAMLITAAMAVAAIGWQRRHRGAEAADMSA